MTIASAKWSTHSLKEDPHGWWSRLMHSLVTQSGMVVSKFAAAIDQQPRTVRRWIARGLIPSSNTACKRLEEAGLPRAKCGTSLLIAVTQARAAALVVDAAARKTAKVEQAEARVAYRAEKARFRPCMRCSTQTQWRVGPQVICAECVKQDPLADIPGRPA